MEPTIAAKAPIKVELVEGKTYWWCACGRSKAQPFCDGSHKGTDLVPLAYKAEASRAAWLCACKRTAGRPFCDGTHKTL